MEEQLILTINLGSASKKYAFFRGEQNVLRLRLEHVPGGFAVQMHSGGQATSGGITQEQYNAGVEYALEIAERERVFGPQTPLFVGLRIVAPGSYFLKHRVIDDEYRCALEEARVRAPLHLIPVLVEIAALDKFLPEAPLVGVSDSAFHAVRPDVSKWYGLPHDLAQTLDLFRFGYHGLSAASIVARAPQFFGATPARAILAHLGSGSSIIALDRGQTVDTSMGYSPLEGPLMTTRAGSVDVEAIAVLLSSNFLHRTAPCAGQSCATEDVLKILNQESGLLGVSGWSGDVRALLEAETNQPRAKFALALFAYQVRRHIGAALASLGGCDALIFTGAIGERSATMRRRIIFGLEPLGLIMDELLNEAAIESDALISSKQSTVTIATMVTNEDEEIARVTRELFS